MIKTRRHKKGKKGKTRRNKIRGLNTTQQQRGGNPGVSLSDDFRGQIFTFVRDVSGVNLAKDIKSIHGMYEKLALHKEIKEDPIILKQAVNNFIDYTASNHFGTLIKNKNLDEKNLESALFRRELLIDQFTRLNTKPNVDPLIERLVTTFWPEADAIKYKRPQPKIISKETLIETRLYPTIPLFNNKANQEGNKTYGSKIMTLTEKVNGDQSDYDTLGVEMFLNTLMTTGSNISFKPEIAYHESYLIDEKIDNSLFVRK